MNFSDKNGGFYGILRGKRCKKVDFPFWIKYTKKLHSSIIIQEMCQNFANMSLINKV